MIMWPPSTPDEPSSQPQPPRPEEMPPQPPGPDIFPGPATPEEVPQPTEPDIGPPPPDQIPVPQPDLVPTPPSSTPTMALGLTLAAALLWACGGPGLHAAWAQTGQTAPDTRGTAMPVIPPPGTPEGDPNVRPQ